ncbi:hypothetical protein [uncultured Sulfitobacter sp.]|uniref:hypothetical protein n=1 Tax=Sulfitobacter sp. SH22 TaxID=3421172 RepID=UPI0025E62CF6|nr:hypothetical protein [uncultured Sulfitobacter sp.]
MTDTICTTLLGRPVPQNSDLTAEQSIDAFEALCDALFRAFRADYQYFCAQTSAERIERHADAYAAWHTVHVSLSAVARITSLMPALETAVDQLSNVFVMRLTKTKRHTVDSAALVREAGRLRSERGQDDRLADLLMQAGSYVQYSHDPSYPIPDINDLLDEA